MGFDDVFESIGGIGIYQICLYLLLGLPSFYGGYQSMAMTFLGPKHDHWCKVERLANLTAVQQKYISIPYSEKMQHYDSCQYYILPYQQMSDEDLLQWNWTLHNESVSTQECEEWSFDQDEYTFTAISKYLLVCDRTYLTSLVYCSFTTSTIVANLLAGPLSDRFGRRTLLLVAVSFEGLLGILAAYAPNYPSFLILRFLLALSITLATTCSFVLAIEVFGPNYRAVAGGLYWLFWSFGFLTLPCIAYFVKDFRKLQIILAAPMFITLCFFIFVSESPRWLMSQNKLAETKIIIKKIAKVNRKQVPENIDEILLHNYSIDKIKDKAQNPNVESLLPENFENKQENEDKVTSMNILHLIKIPLLRRHVFLILPGWISCTLIYYGMSFNTGSMVGNVYLNTFLSGLVEVPAYTGSLPFMYKLGRRYSQIGTLIVSGAACFISIPFLNSENLASNVTGITFMMIGKAAITMGFAVIFVYTAELFPTPIRHQAVAIPYMTGNVFGLATPFMGSFMMDLWRPLPFVIFGTLGVLSGLLVFLLPETRDIQLPDDLKDIQTIGKVGFLKRLRINKLDKAEVISLSERNCDT